MVRVARGSAPRLEPPDSLVIQPHLPSIPLGVPAVDAPLIAADPFLPGAFHAAIHLPPQSSCPRAVPLAGTRPDITQARPTGPQGQALLSLTTPPWAPGPRRRPLFLGKKRKEGMHEGILCSPQSPERVAATTAESQTEERVWFGRRTTAARVSRIA